MKFIETQQSKVDKDCTVYVFKMGSAEVVILRDILDYLYKVVPESFFTMPFVSRLRDMRREVHKVVDNYGLIKGRKRMKGWDPRNPNETF